MVLFFTSNAVEPSATIYMGRDKVESAFGNQNQGNDEIVTLDGPFATDEDLIKYGTTADIWFHVDKLSSAHVYLRLTPSIDSWEKIPQTLLVDCAQLVKANSIEGNKKDNLTVIYTPWDNLKNFKPYPHSENRGYGGRTSIIPQRQKSEETNPELNKTSLENAIVNRLNKTKVERDPDHEQERIDRLKAETAKKRMQSEKERKAQAALAKARKEEKEARSYSTLFEGVEEDPTNQKSVQEMEDDFM
ncbi:hypothetical protein FRB97_006886 [Tulasnella sp. 331]|nr:hypothetical protein FRB97_006886 [Tulasnella sp. 331]KAG8877349.1 hypothetical protein FRB98_006751 [Tulasnella sp. 332]